VQCRSHQHSIDTAFTQAINIFPAFHTATGYQFDLWKLSSNGTQEFVGPTAASSAHASQVENDEMATSHLNRDASKPKPIASVPQAPSPPIADQFTIAKID
jgi:hypothetical protein